MNYEQLSALHTEYHQQGLEILAFPCNQFGGQEPGNEQQIKEFVKKYDVQFTMFSKVDVNGPNASPVFKYLKSQKRELLGNDIKWNFAKFLVSRDGRVVKRYAPNVNPKDIVPDIKNELARTHADATAATAGEKDCSQTGN